MTNGMTDASSISYRSPLLDLCVSKPLADLVAFIKVKRVATNLSTRHLRQVETYALNEASSASSSPADRCGRSTTLAVVCRWRST
jgi:hypothetical protein